jgi:hypothetical protein
MKVLVATRNKDKFKIVRRMVEKIIPYARLVSPADAGIPGDVIEVGSVEERARQKAQYFMERLEWSKKIDDFDAVLAVDDALSIDGGEATPNSKELTDRILQSEWPAGASIAVVRAFALIKKGERTRVEVTTVPFTFIGNPLNVEREYGKYPLSRVLAPQGKAIPVCELSTEEEDEFNLAHSSEALTRLFS